MKSTLNKVIIFAIGAAIGSLVAWKLTKTKYEKIMIEEEQSLREYYNKKTKVYEDSANTLHDYYNDQLKEIDEKEKKMEEDKKTEESKIVDDLRERYAEVLKDHKYSIDEPCYEGGQDRPYVVTPEEFGNADEYDIISLNYYADGIVSDDWGDKIEDLEAAIGEDFASHYGEYEEDAVYIRNDRLKVEYEVLKSLSKYSEMFPAEEDDE